MISQVPYPELVATHGVLEAGYILYGFASRREARRALWVIIEAKGCEKFYSHYQVVRKP